ncbi:MAG TPA: alpha/beta hydrolase [Chitinophagaceae bacterium]|nr:alpha/beta hydrolase [Chitinophagaceae bacterium]
MKNILLVLLCLLTIQFCRAQSAPYYKAGDSLYKAKDYKNAALAYTAGIREDGKAASITRYWGAASRWSMAGETDSAYRYLTIITQSDKVNRVQAKNIEYDIDLIPVKNDKRWQTVINKIHDQADKNGYPQEEFIYGRKDGIALTLICIKPKVKANGKGIIYVISGSWFSSYNGIEMPTGPAEQFLAKGYTVFGVVHGSQPRYAIPDAVNDIKRAVRYIRFNAAKFSIDPDHIGITGTSAGGHLSLVIATADDKINTAAPDPIDRVSSRVQAVAVLFPPTDLLNWGGPGLNLVNAKEPLKMARSWGAADFREWNNKYALYEEVTDTAARNKIGRDNSSMYFVSPDDPPVFIIHGDADPTVPLQQSQAIIARFNEAGVPNRFIIKKGGKHNGDDMNPEWQEFVDWFDKYLK